MDRDEHNSLPELVKQRVILLKLLALGCTSMVAMTGCAVNFGPQVGNLNLAKYDQQSLEREFPYGISTTKDVLLKLGPPVRTSIATGYEIWIYSQENLNSAGILFMNVQMGTRKVATFYFQEKRGLLEKIDYKTESR